MKFTCWTGAQYALYCTVVFCLWTTVLSQQSELDKARENKDFKDMDLDDIVVDKCTTENATMICKDGFQCGPCLRSKCATGMGECLPCMMGDLCINGTRNPYFYTLNNVCPQGSICRNSSHEGVCPPGWVCPHGTFYLTKNHLCPDDKGLYCAPGSHRPKGCPSGKFCPNSTVALECPHGYFCKEFSMLPTICNYGSECKPGSSSPKPSTVGVVCSIVGLIIGLIIILIVEKLLARRQAKQARDMQRRVLMRTTGQTVLAKLLGVPVASLAESVPGFGVAEMPIEIEFQSLKLEVGDKVLLHNVTGKFEAGSLVAVMGPSGCGKSTLLNTITGKATYGEQKGKILVNGEEVEDTEELKKVIGFVPQDDTVFAQLTVLENLQFSARLRLRTDISRDKTKLQAITYGAVQILGLDHVQNSIVGSVEKRGISGGQKKRVNIGVELVADPTVLFMDEPTSGLGATDTLLVMKACRSFAGLKRTVVAVIHQPRYSVFTLFSDVTLLARGGFVVYMGDAGHALTYFQGLGFVLPANENPADFFLDIISGMVPLRNKKMAADYLPTCYEEYVTSGARAEAEAKIKAREASASNDFQSWISNAKKEWDAHDKDHSGSLDLQEFIQVLNACGVHLRKSEVTYAISVFDDNNSGTVEYHEFLDKAKKQYEMLNQKAEVPIVAGNPAKRKTPMFLEQLVVFLDRAWLQWLRDFRTNAVDVFLVMVAAIIVGALLGSSWGYKDIPSNACMSTVCIGVLSCVSALKLFGEERVLFWREKAAGVSTIAYFLAKNVVNLVDNIWRPALFLTLYYNFLLPNCKFVDYMLVMILACYATSGIGLWLSTLLKPTSALLMGVIFPLVTGVFLAGVNNPRLGEMDDALKVISGISFTRWATEAITILELESEKSYQWERVDAVYDAMGYHKDHYGDCLLALFIIGVAFRALAYVFMTDFFKKIFEKLEDIADKIEDVGADLGILDESSDEEGHAGKEGIVSRARKSIKFPGGNKKVEPEAAETTEIVKVVDT